MVYPRRWGLIGVFALGFLLGGVAVQAWQRWADPLPGRRLEATVLVPLVDNTDQALSTEQWHAAVEPLVSRFGGATLGAAAEGCWLNGAGQVRREPLRPVIVSFDPRRLVEFRRAVQEVGRRLGQETMYTRFEEPRIEMLPVKGSSDGGQ